MACPIYNDGRHWNRPDGPWRPYFFVRVGRGHEGGASGGWGSLCRVAAGRVQDRRRDRNPAGGHPPARHRGGAVSGSAPCQRYPRHPPRHPTKSHVAHWPSCRGRRPPAQCRRGHVAFPPPPRPCPGAVGAGGGGARRSAAFPGPGSGRRHPCRTARDHARTGCRRSRGRQFRASGGGGAPSRRRHG